MGFQRQSVPEVDAYRMPREVLFDRRPAERVLLGVKQAAPDMAIRAAIAELATIIRPVASV